MERGHPSAEKEQKRGHCIEDTRTEPEAQGVLELRAVLSPGER
jgi:hypothetical protein